MNDTVDLQGAAEILNCSEEHARELANTGVLPGGKVGASWVFLRSDLLEWLRNEIRSQQRQRAIAVDAGVPVKKIQRRSARATVRRREPPVLPELPQPR